MKTFICNAFSLNMIPHRLVGRISIAPIDLAIFAGTIISNNVQSYLGHKDIVSILNKEVKNLTGWDPNLEYNRETFTFPVKEIPTTPDSTYSAIDGVLLVAQYSGPRLPEGTTELPKDAKINFYAVFDYEQIHVIGDLYQYGRKFE